jgi:hypothetical protein
MTVNAATMEGHIRNEGFDSSFKPLVSFLSRIFGCWHVHMGWPITASGETYRTCLDCGARRRFDPKKLDHACPFTSNMNDDD